MYFSSFKTHPVPGNWFDLSWFFLHFRISWQDSGGATYQEMPIFQDFLLQWALPKSRWPWNAFRLVFKNKHIKLLATFILFKNKSNRLVSWVILTWIFLIMLCLIHRKAMYESGFRTAKHSYFSDNEVIARTQLVANSISWRNLIFPMGNSFQRSNTPFLYSTFFLFLPNT